MTMMMIKGKPLEMEPYMPTYCLSTSHHHLTPSNVTSKLTTLPHHSTHHLATSPNLWFNSFFLTLARYQIFLHYIMYKPFCRSSSRCVVSGWNGEEKSNGGETSGLVPGVQHPADDGDGKGDPGTSCDAAGWYALPPAAAAAAAAAALVNSDR